MKDKIKKREYTFTRSEGFGWKRIDIFRTTNFLKDDPIGMVHVKRGNGTKPENVKIDREERILLALQEMRLDELKEFLHLLAQ